MLFNSWEFLILLLVTVPLYYFPFFGSARKVWQVGLLLGASAIFYGWGSPALLFLLGASCLLNAIAVERILSLRLVGGENEETRARYWLRGAVAANLGALAFFKYAGFLGDFLPADWLPAETFRWLGSIPLPVGISFYTFQGISLVVDVWRRDISPMTAERLGGRGAGRWEAIRDTSFYISFFPQLVAGPIVKAHEFVDQIGAKVFVDIDWLLVRRSLIVGYFLKIFVADNIAEQTAMLTMGSGRLEGALPINLICLLYGYSFQIFADFAGYSLIAIGLGALFGYRLPDNFRFPYLSASITEFWQRWHLSLSSWLRDYLYIPLGGNRKGVGRTYFNLFLVMFLGGLWHGAAWKFALWGSCHGLLLAVERFLFRRRGKRESSLDRNTIRSVLTWLLTFQMVSFLWLTFMMPDLASIQTFFESLTSGRQGFSGPPIFSLVFYGGAVVLYHGWGWLREHQAGLALRADHQVVEGMVHALMVFLVLTNPGAPRGFIYFQF